MPRKTNRSTAHKSTKKTHRTLAREAGKAVEAIKEVPVDPA